MLDFRLHLDTIILHCPVNSSVLSRRNFTPDFLSEVVNPNSYFIITGSRPLQINSSHLEIHNWIFIYRNIAKEVFKSKAFFYSSFLPYMLPFFYLTVQILLKLYSLPGNKCFICNGLFNPHPYDFRCQCSHSAIEKTNTLRDCRPSK